MSRPLMQLGILELESIFAKSRRDMQVLRDLEEELQHRHVLRAKSLLGTVRTAMKATRAAVPTTVREPPPTSSPSEVTLEPELELFNPARSTVPEPKSVVPEETKPARAREEGPPVPLSEAYKLLRTNPGSQWESIELMRRQLVQRASPAVAPSEQLLQLQAEANRVNAAYKAIVDARLQVQ